MPKFSPQTWLIIAVLAYILPMTGVYFLYLSPLFSEADKAREDSLSTEEYTILKNTANQLTQFKERISDRSNAKAIRTTLDSVAVQTGVRVVDVRADTSVEQLNAGFLLRGYTITVEGQYVLLNNFMNHIEYENNYFMVSNFALVRVDDRTGAARAQCTLRVLTVPEQKKMASPPQQEQKTSATLSGHGVGAG